MKSESNTVSPVKRKIIRTLPLLRGMFIYPESLKRRDKRSMRLTAGHPAGHSAKGISMLSEA